MDPQQRPTNSFDPNKPLFPEEEVNPRMHLIKKIGQSLTGTLGLVIAAPLLALFLTAHIFQPYEVDGASMETTLQNTDRLIVFKLPKTWANISGGDYRPSRGDVIVFDRPKQLNASARTEHLIKRVIGLPGERVVIKDGTVTVYNAEKPDGFNPDKGMDYSGDIVTTPGQVDITVGRSEVFVLGDNRTNSTDSRVFGPISDEIIVGKAVTRFLPLNKMTKL
jgi:signal peptidase I